MISSAPPGGPAKAREKRPPIGRNSKTTAENRTKALFPTAHLLNVFRQLSAEKDDERGEQKDRGRRRKQHDGHHEDPHGDVRGQGGKDHRGEAEGQNDGVPEKPVAAAGAG